MSVTMSNKNSLTASVSKNFTPTSKNWNAEQPFSLALTNQASEHKTTQKEFYLLGKLQLKQRFVK